MRPYSLLPVKEYYEKYPDSVRFYLNQQSQDDFEQRQGSEVEVKNWLMQNRINTKNVGLDTSKVRETFYKREQLIRHIQAAQQRMRLLIDDSRNTAEYAQSRRDAVKEGQWLAQVGQVVDEVFDEHYSQREQKVVELTG